MMTRSENASAGRPVSVRADVRGDLCRLLVSSLAKEGYNVGTATGVVELLALHINVQMQRIAVVRTGGARERLLDGSVYIENGSPEDGAPGEQVWELVRPG